MKTTLLFKQIDMTLQIIAFVAPITIAICIADYTVLFGMYISVGAVQFTSSIINKMLLDPFLKNDTRKYYELCLAGIIALTFLACITHVPAIGEVLLYCLLFATPFMAIWYFCFTVTEMNNIRRMVDRKQYV